MKKLLIACAFSVSSLLSLFTLPASAQVVINGYLFQGEELAQLEYFLGAPVPDGSYWLNTNTGDWGYAGDATVQGNLLAAPQSRSSSGAGSGTHSYYQGNASSYSSYASDGECAYFSTEYGSFSSCD
ncbi:MAG: hypothetical protein HY785_29135 [Oscillatoriophycideae cyanobacterium NC_groundwater_1537_Pr4_S-0.65um_50_18]|nr:hypothetical protein [Oscillatoriophycideae cyanobacterium NC_groundwater_1537_Pr4_S-0.65um_50_18]